jgi:D-3-phosphoglycerate dehydrogenase
MRESLKMSPDREHPAGVFVYDPLDYPVDALLERNVRVTLGASLRSPGVSRPKFPADELVRAARGHEVLLGASGALITREVMEGIGTLRMIAKLGIGYEVVDVEAATSLGIVVTNTPVHGEIGPVAEHAIALMLAAAKRLDWYHKEYLAKGGWKDPEHMSYLLSGSTVGIVGLGHIGRAVAVRLAGWDCRLLGCDPAVGDGPPGVEMVDLGILLRESDVVTLHAPGGPPGAGPLLTSERIASMKDTAILVNTARGNLVDENAIAEALQHGTLGAAALDVYAPEPPPAGAAILSAPNVVLTPHMAAWSPSIRKEMVEMAFGDILRFLDEGRATHVVNPEVLAARP